MFVKLKKGHFNLNVEFLSSFFERSSKCVSFNFRDIEHEFCSARRCYHWHDASGTRFARRDFDFFDFLIFDFDF